MKKRYLLFSLLIVLLLPAVTYSSYEQDGFPLKDSAIFRNIVFQRSENAPLLGEIVYVPKEAFQGREAIGMVTRLSAINPSILKSMAERQLRIRLFTGKLTDQHAFSHLKGVKPRGYSENGPTWDLVPGAGGAEIVYVKIGSSAKGQGHGSVNLELHETAHTIDKYVLNGIRYHPAFLKAWQKERERIFPGRGYFLMYPEEYFAETFAMFYFSQLTRNQLKENAPDTYRFLQQALERPKKFMHDI
ncbi:MAG TPA: toxin [Bacillus sp. (in: firmicutes)]|nr:toxin [Bacillus sp. (in: firmicutes)]